MKRESIQIPPCSTLAPARINGPAAPTIPHTYHPCTCERSIWHRTAMPVGTCLMRTAVSTCSASKRREGAAAAGTQRVCGGGWGWGAGGRLRKAQHRCPLQGSTRGLPCFHAARCQRRAAPQLHAPASHLVHVPPPAPPTPSRPQRAQHAPCSRSARPRRRCASSSPRGPPRAAPQSRPARLVAGEWVGGWGGVGR